MQEMVGILGGTFDPIHYGHLRLGQEMLNLHPFKCIHFIPCFKPVHRKEPTTLPEKRLKMLELAIKNQSSFIADDREIKRETLSFTIDTLLSFREEMPNATVCLIIGSDAFSSYPTWHKPHEILELAHIIVAHRPNYTLEKSSHLQPFIDQYQTTDALHLQQKQFGCIYWQPITALDISAKMIRQQMLHQQSPQYLLPDDVYHYIKSNQLYLTQ